MKTLKTIITSLVLIFITACSKDDDSIAQETAHKNLLIKSIDSDDQSYKTYVYDANNRLTGYTLVLPLSSYSKTFSFSYNSFGKISEFIDVSNSETLEKYFYTTDGSKLIKRESGDGEHVHTFTYENNQVTDNYRQTSVGTGWREVYTYDSKGNVIEQKSFSNTSNSNPIGTLSNTIKYTYSTKNSARSSIPKEFYFPFTYINNIETQQYNNESVYTYTYEYNQDNYPTKVIGNYTTTYEYTRL